MAAAKEEYPIEKALGEELAEVIDGAGSALQQAESLRSDLGVGFYMRHEYAAGLDAMEKELQEALVAVRAAKGILESEG